MTNKGLWNEPLRAHAHDGARGRPDEGDSFLCETVGELGVLAEKTVSWMDCLLGSGIR